MNTHTFNIQGHVSHDGHLNVWQRLGISTVQVIPAALPRVLMINIFVIFLWTLILTTQTS